MRIPGPVHEFAPLLSAERLSRVYDPAAVRRGQTYADGGAVRGLVIVEVDEDVLAVSAEVWGTAPHPYEVDVTIDVEDGGVSVDADCTCPVGVWCKHGAAVLLRLGRSLDATPSPVAATAAGGEEGDGWSGALDSALAELDAARSRDPGDGGLALLLDLDLPRTDRWAVRTRPVLRMRPMRRGARGGWIRGGVGWKDVSPHGVPGMRGTHDPHHYAVLAKLRTTLSDGSSYYWQPTDNPEVGDFGGQLWHLLRRARDAGVVMLPGAGLTDVALVDEPLRVVGDVVRGEDGGTLRFGIEHADRWWPAERILWVGEEPHGVALLDPDTGRAVLGGLSAPLPTALAALVREGGTSVPTLALEAFTANQLPRLARHLPIRSSDGSVVVPDPPAPRLALAVLWDRTPAAELRWEWRYRLGARDLAAPVGSSARLDGVRDLAAERSELARLTATGVLAEPPESGTVPAGEVLVLAEETLPRLRAAGIEVEEAERPDFRPATGGVQIAFTAEADSDAVSTSGSVADAEAGDHDWLDLTISVTVDGEHVPLPTVLSALTLGHERVVLPSGLHVPTATPELEHLRELVAAAAELREPGEDRIGLGRHDLGLWARVGDLADVDVLPAQARTWVARARALRDLTDLPDPEPRGLASQLRGYQRDGFRWLAFLHEHGLGGILADDMGLGKTLQTLALVAHARKSGAAPFLVVAPTSVVATWAAEAARHTPGLEVRTVPASTRKLGAPVSAVADGADLVVTTYTLLRLDADEYAAVPWGGLVLDEAQHVKNHLAKTHQAVRRVEAPFRLAVTGTPFENRLLELWSLLALVAPGLYPSVEAFTENVVRPVEKHGDAAALQRFRQRLRPFVLRRTKELVAKDLPPKQEQVLEVEIGPKHRKIYDAHLARERQKILGLVDDFARNRVAIFSALTRLRQLSLDPALVDADHDRVGSAKIDVLVEHLAELAAEGHRALVFSQFTGFLRRVRDRLDAEGLRHSYLDGRTRKRAEAVARFRDGDAPVFLISLKAGGVGLTLTEADYVFVLDPWWNPAVEAQAVDRAHRIGQTRPVLVYRLVSRGTVEEKVMALKERKATLFAEVVDGDGALGSVVGAEDVRALFE